MSKRIGIALSLLLMAALIIFTGCGGEEEPEETILEVTITQHPQGGVNVQSVSCTFECEITNGSGTVQVTIEWWWEDAAGLNDQVVETDYVDFTQNQPVSHTTTFSAPAAPQVIIISFIVNLIPVSTDSCSATAVLVSA